MMERIPSPNELREGFRDNPREQQRPEARSDIRPVDDGRQRMRSGDAVINPYNIDDIRKLYCPTNGTGTAEQVAGETDFQWNNYETYGKRDFSQLRAYYDQGWRNVPHSMFPDRFAPTGTEGPVIVNDMILMERPMRLTVQARQEDYVRATRSMQVHRLKMAEAPEGQAPRTTPVIKTSREAIEIPD
jgi:hypothetical protein